MDGEEIEERERESRNRECFERVGSIQILQKNLVILHEEGGLK